MVQIELYKSVLNKLSHIPVEYLQIVDDFLSELNKKVEEKESNRNDIMDFAGMWSDMDEEDFNDICESRVEQVAERRYNKPVA